MSRKIAFILIMVFPLLLSAQESKPELKKDKILEQKVVEAVRANGDIVIDGILDEDVWNGKGYTDFTQSDPHDGEEPTEKTKVWVAYDEQALYVAARLYDSDPKAITSRLGRRDDFVDSDWFIFAVDPYYDRRTGFQFAVNPAGSIVDWSLFNDEWNDTTWDGVWEGKTKIDDQGWTVELRIPYNQLRFSTRDEYVWGVNFRRIIKRKNEKLCFVWVPKEDSGYVSRFARLIGIRDIHPGRHIEFLPYTVAQAQYSPKELGNPFETGQQYLGDAGFDLKVGLKTNLTLDLTVNPDFGQVEVDPAVVNLSAFESYFQEKRPFFIEGSTIFSQFGYGGATSNVNISWSAPDFFYSRRIGRSPQGDVSRAGHVNFPERTTILGAFKLTGKVGKDWNIGIISALTAREYAEIDSSGDRFHEEVEPFSYYGVLRAQKEFNEGKQGVGFLMTSVVRDLDHDGFKDSLNDNAFSLAFDGWTFLDGNKAWVINGWLGGTRVAGSRSAILDLQKSSLHYYQRPDATHVELDELATSLVGWGGRISVNKQKGRLLFNSAIGALSPGFDPNDIGFQFGSSDIINAHLLVGYSWPHPGKVLRNCYIYGGPFRNYDFGGNKIWDGSLFIIEGQFLNYWSFNTLLAYNPKTLSNRMTRGGPLVRIPEGFEVDSYLSSDSRKPVVVSAFNNVYRRPAEGSSWSGGLSIRWKPKSNISFSIGPDFYIRRTKAQWVTRINDPLMTATFGARYIFGELHQRILSSDIRLNWTFTPKLTLQLYLQPFIGVGSYSRFKELAQPKSYDFNVFGEGLSTVLYSDEEYTVDPDGPGPASPFSFGDPDFNVKSLRGTMVLRWEYFPGSILYFVWTQSRQDYSHPGDLNLRRDLGDLLTAPGDNIFLIKVSYRWNM